MIFDLGFHNGNDTEFYLSKGFKVVAVEPNPSLCKKGRGRFKKEITEQRLMLLEKAISSEDNFTSFFLHPKNNEWSSCEKWLAERNGETSTMISVDTITLTRLIELYGVPYYLKVDTEGEEIPIAKELLNLKNKPKYISFETSRTTYRELFLLLFETGYKEFQLRNQLNNTEFSSGDFGEFLPDKWFDFKELMTRYRKYAELKYIDNINLALGWLDVHAKL
jgi:FkbM family methyltransferase